jgi:transposase InsO family protein
VYWMLHGVRHERIRPAHPEENGRHERMHRTLKAETTRPARSNLLQQQEQFDAFRQVYNTKRPHEALDMKRPADVYRSSARPCPAAPPEPQYRCTTMCFSSAERDGSEFPASEPST